MERKKLYPCFFYFWIVFLAAAGLIVLQSCSKKENHIQDLNLLFFTLDTTRADRLGAYGHENAETPHLDFLANNGVMFENCYAPVPLTLPSHSTMFTGKYPLSTNVRDNGISTLENKEVTLAEKLKEQDYDTFAVIASYVLMGKFGLNQGFDMYDDSLNSHKVYNNYSSEIPASAVYSKFLQWFEKNYQKKFFAWVHFYDPHMPYEPPKEYGDKFTNDTQGQYDAEVAYTDVHLGQIIEQLKAKNIFEQTLIVVAGDHGEAFGEHGEMGHGIFCYEEALKVPLIFYNARLFKEPKKISNRVNLVDILPTILELFGLKTPEEVQGKSFVPLLQGKSEKGNRRVYFESLHGQNDMNWAPLMGIIEGRFKYISLPEPELYDLESDREEKINLFESEMETSQELDKILRTWVAGFSQSRKESRRELTEEDKKQLRALGYISPFSGRTTTSLDPKKGILLDSSIKEIFSAVGKGDLTHAEKELKTLLSENSDIQMPLFFDLQYNLYSAQNEAGKKLAVLKQALSAFPENERFLILYALTLFETGQFLESENTCRVLLSLNPKHTRAIILLGEIEESRNNLDKTISYYEEALDLEPQNLSLKLKYSELLILKKEYERALLLYETLLERDEISRNVNLLFKIALFFSQYGSPARSEELLNQAVALEPNGKHYFNYALVLSKNNKWEQALKNMELALKEYRTDLTGSQIELAEKAVNIWKKQFN